MTDLKAGRHPIIRRFGAPARMQVAHGRAARLIAFTLSTESRGLEPDNSGSIFLVPSGVRSMRMQRWCMGPVRDDREDDSETTGA
jgi:hypothetical protein